MTIREFLYAISEWFSNLDITKFPEWFFNLKMTEFLAILLVIVGIIIMISIAKTISELD